MSAVILVLLGTDHHPFRRLVDWTDAAARRDPATTFIVQHGASAAPQVAEGHEFLSQTDLAGLLARADGVVCHGGPGTLMDAREAGHRPVCVPRDSSLGEHVDDHQLRFAALVGGSGVATTVTTEAEFQQAIDGLVAAAAAGRRRAGGNGSDGALQARQRLARELDGLMVTAPRPVRRRRGPRLPGATS